MRGGFRRMDESIQRSIEEAERSGDPDKIKEAHQFARESYGMGTGVIIGGIVGTILFPGVGTYVGAAIGGFFGHESAK